MQFFLYFVYSLCSVCPDIQKSTLEDRQPFTYVKVKYKVNGATKSLSDVNIKVNSFPGFYTTVIRGNSQTVYPERAVLNFSFYADPDFKTVANNSIYEVKFSKGFYVTKPPLNNPSAALQLKTVAPVKSFCIELTQVPFLGLTTEESEACECILNITSPILTTTPKDEFIIRGLGNTPVLVARFQGGVELYSNFLWKIAKNAIESCFSKAIMGCTTKIKGGIEKIQCYLKGEKLRKILAELTKSCFMQKDQKYGPICPPEPLPCPPEPYPCPPQPPAPCPVPYPVYPAYGPPTYCIPQKNCIEAFISIQFYLSLQDRCSQILNMCQSNHPMMGHIAAIPYTPHGGYVCKVNTMLGYGYGGKASGFGYSRCYGYTPTTLKTQRAPLKKKPVEESSSESGDEKETRRPKKIMSTTTVVLVACGGFVGVVAVGVAVYYFI